MALSWNEIKKRAIEFSKEWENDWNEKAEAQTFWNEFFNVFGISRRRVALFEQEVEKLDKSKGYIDLFWPKVLVAEAKSKKKDLIKAKGQALSYLYGIKQEDLPKYVLTSDFEKMVLLDLETGQSIEFFVSELHNRVKLFAFIAGYEKTEYKEEDPVNIEAAELMGKLHDKLLESGYTGHNLEIFLVRILFCLFADDTGIFEQGLFYDFIKDNTRDDGNDLGPHLAFIFQLLNTPEDKRYSNLDEVLQKYPYVNGRLFEEQIPLPQFDSSMRWILLECSMFNWSQISPAVFGSMFQSVMDKEKRRNLGAHYTSEKNILKLIKPLFLDDLWEEFHSIKHSKQRLVEFHNKIASLKFLDPACGCGNFLVVSYRELRLLELEVLKIILRDATSLDISLQLKLNVDQFYGIEIEEWPAKIAEVAMWLVDHQMNVKFSEQFGKYFVRLPLKQSAKIIHGNALRIDWEEIINKKELSYILGNPPFVGKHLRSKEQSEDQNLIMNDIDGSGVLDFVACWYIKAANYIQDTFIKVAFVSTNSITQGEQVGILWNEMFRKFNIKIHFAHRTFQWNSDSKGKAAVHVVIIGYANFDIDNKNIFEYEDIKAEPHSIKAKNINPYLVEGNDIIILHRTKPISDVPEIVFGNMPNDGGHLLVNDSERLKLLEKEPELEKYIKPLLGAYEYLNGGKRYCFWLVNANPKDIASSKILMERINNVRTYRLSSKREATRKLAKIPSLFGEIRQPTTDYILIPRHSSENRIYVPFGFFDSNNIVHDSCLLIPNANKYIFGIIQSALHMTWMKYVAGRLKSDYRYSNTLVYNNFPWATNVDLSLKSEVEQFSDQILDIRKEFANISLSDLYNPLSMPSSLVYAHKNLDLAVDKCYRNRSFKDERERIEFLFGLYSKYLQSK